MSDMRPEEDAGRPEARREENGALPQDRPGREGDSTAEIVELEDRWRRTLADLDNFRKRAARDAERLRARERAGTAAEWLPVLDNLERAIAHADAEDDAVLEGVRAVRDQALEVLARLGFARRQDEGRSFDPTLHEAVGVDANADVPDGTIVKVVRPGYGEGESQLRPALVVVAKGRGDGTGP